MYFIIFKNQKFKALFIEKLYPAIEREYFNYIDALYEKYVPPHLKKEIEKIDEYADEKELFIIDLFGYKNLFRVRWEDDVDPVIPGVSGIKADVEFSYGIPLVYKKFNLNYDRTVYTIKRIDHIVSFWEYICNKYFYNEIALFYLIEKFKGINSIVYYQHKGKKNFFPISHSRPEYLLVEQHEFIYLLMIYCLSRYNVPFDLNIKKEYRCDIF
ncbi:MAG: hypothetical protein ACTSQP_23135 [Promethearchaeota archaeon]